MMLIIYKPSSFIQTLCILKQALIITSKIYREKI
ncbi:unnamed protein product [Paramecium octaurelia]|uniref:Uncharacterized protein n=1 Tax=Paramecium octaurelia TaxID=43137 RepID=A0A8S1XZ39_PAROT|nr:unnamed protein product [Paramecium octaurelia]